MRQRPVAEGFPLRGQRAVAIDAQNVVCRFGTVMALAGVDFAVASGEIHALLGPNGAGKTTLLRVLTGALTPTSGTVTVAGRRPDLLDARSKQAISVVPAGDRSFYLRISGLENLVFFGRMEGLSRRAAVARAATCLDAVGIAEARDRMVGLYSQGMKKRLALARALLVPSPVLVLDEATHDLDVQGAARIRQLITDRATQGAAVVWATQLLDEIRGFAHSVTVLHRGGVRFRGTVSALLRTTTTQRFLLRLAADGHNGVPLGRLRHLVGDRGTVDAATEANHVHLGLNDGAVLGDVLATLARDGIRVTSCNEEQSLVEAALRRLTADDDQRVAAR